MRSIWYWRRAVIRAWRNTRSTLGHNWGKSIITTIVTMGAVAFYGSVEGGYQAWAKIEWWLACGGSAALLFLLVFGCQLFRVPADLECEN